MPSPSIFAPIDFKQLARSIISGSFAALSIIVLPFAKIEARKLGRIGCYLSHMEALEYAISNNYENILIFEDDCQFTDYANDTDINPPENCDIFYCIYYLQYPKYLKYLKHYFLMNFQDIQMIQ